MSDAGVVCAACGTRLPANSKFCNECGSPVSARANAAEYKQVTVLFADVVHSMDLASAVGAERLREIMAELLDRCTDVVKRYSGTVNSFTGDGIMAVFGAPTALEDHAFRACLTALGIQHELRSLSDEVANRDGIALSLRIGLNSGQVIAGDIGSAAASYTAIGEQVGMAQRMESVSPAGGVMLSESTSRLVEGCAALGEPEFVYIKGASTPVAVRRLLAIGERKLRRRSEPTFVGRTWELNTVTSILDEAARGAGCVIDIVGPPGIGKSRLVREAAAIAAARGVPVFGTYCESHARDVPFHVLARLLRAGIGVDDADDETARARVREQFAGADSADLLLLDDLLGIRKAAVALPEVAADARRRRLTALINSASLERGEPAMYVIEDAHWIDEASESMLTDFLAVVPQSHAVTLITYRSEYRGALTRIPGAQKIALRPLSDAHVLALNTEMLGAGPSVQALADTIAERAAGNPFFAQELIRDLSERGTLQGEPGKYELRGDIADVEVPATLQAAIGARIDRLSPTAKQTLHAASVIGAQFDADLLTAVSNTADVAPLIEAELVDQIRFSPYAAFAFRHPMIRTVAYESQLKVDRAQLHRRLAMTIEQRDPGSVEENAAMIAEHYEAANDLHAAFDWHMKAGSWSNLRDNTAASQSWRRALAVADRLAEDEPGRLSMRIAPRSLLCATAYRSAPMAAGAGFDELRDLCLAAGDRQSLAVGMFGQIMEQFFRGNRRESSRISSELAGLLESIGDPTLTMALIGVPLTHKFEAGGVIEALRWAEWAIELAGGDATKGKLTIGSPLALAIAMRGTLRSCLGIAGWREDLQQAVDMSRGEELITRTATIYYTYTVALLNGMLLPDEYLLGETAEALTTAERVAENITVGMARTNRGLALIARGGADREGGLELLAQVRESAARQQYSMVAVPLIDAIMANDAARVGDYDRAIELSRSALEELTTDGGAIWVPLSSAVLTEAHVRRGVTKDIDEAQAAADRLAALPTDPGVVLNEIWLLRSRALVAQAREEDAAYREHRDHYRSRAAELGFEGHIAMAEAMP